jgi:HEAT repeat protein
VVPKIIEATKSADYWVQHSALRLLDMLEVDPSTLPTVTKAAAPEPKATAHPAFAILSEMLFDRDRDLRLAAATALGKLREKSAGSILNMAHRDADAIVSQAAKAALATLN